MAALLDVNALIALVDTDHINHAPMTRWFRQHHRAGWATCPLTESGMIRILSQPAYPGGRRTPAEVINVLIALKSAFEASYEFWVDNISLTDSSLFDAPFVAGSRQVTDAYLLGLVMKHSGTLVSFDQSLPLDAIRGGSQKLIHNPAERYH